MKIHLLFPPHWTPTMPHLALPTLTAFLRARGLDVVQRDLNLEVFDAVLTRDFVEQSAARLRRMRRHALSPEMVREKLAQAPQLAAQVEDAKAVIRSDAFFDGSASLPAFLTIVQALELASLPFYPSALGFTSFISPLPEDSSRALADMVRDPQRNLFLSLFRRGILEDLKRDPPDIVAISLPTLNQMLAGMTLAYLIKEAGLPCHVTVGGPHISMLRERIPQVPALFEWIDSAVVFGGEVPLLRLAEALDAAPSGTPGSACGLSKVPNLIYKEGDTIRSTPVQPAQPPNLLPDFDGLPLDRYLTPRLVLPLLSSHGCYHGKCAFCNVGYAGPDGFSQLDPNLVVDHMVALRDRYGARHIFFADEALTPRNLRVMSQRLAALDAPVQGASSIHWCGCVRFDNALSADLLANMAQGGCRMLLFGLETASERTIARMVKGTELPVMSRIVRDSAAAGIWNHTFFFFGFPGETMADAQATVNFVYAHQDAIHSASPGAFLLEQYSPVHQHPAHFGVTHVVDDPDRDLAIYYDYRVASGLDEATADQLASRLVDVLPDKQFGQFYVHDAYRFLYAGYLRESGQPLPLWLA